MNDDSLISKRYFKQSEDKNDDFESTEPSKVQPEVSEGEAMQKIYDILCNYELQNNEKLHHISKLATDYMMSNYEPEIPNDVLNARY